MQITLIFFWYTDQYNSKFYLSQHLLNVHFPEQIFHQLNEFISFFFRIHEVQFQFFSEYDQHIRLSEGHNYNLFEPFQGFRSSRPEVFYKKVVSGLQLY